MKPLLARVRAITMAGVAACLLSSPASAAGNEPARIRVEARSTALLAVGIVRDDHMAIHLSRLIDNSPLRDAVLTVVLRGVVHPTIAEADGGYTLQTEDLRLPGTASVIFQVATPELHEELKAVVQVAPGVATPADKNSSRQLAWWVLNFAVCIGFLVLWNRRRTPTDPG